MPGSDAPIPFLSAAWIDALAAAAAELHVDAGPALVIEQEVTGGADGTVRYQVQVHDGRVAVRAGAAEAPTVRFSSDVATAWEIASGQGSAQRAFMAGRLRVGGDLRALLDHASGLAATRDAFAAVRDRTAAPVADA